MHKYILVHGGDRDGSIWNNVADLLRGQKQEVLCPSMTSIKQSTLQHNIDEVCSLIESRQLTNIILAGHSYGAMVITGVFDQLSDRIACMVYIDSVVPENGQSLFGLLAANGFNYKDHDLTPDQPCIQPLFFDEGKLKEKPKAYIHCMQSEFRDATRVSYQKVIKHAKENHWLYFDLNTVHGCMFTQPTELAVILSGLQVLTSSPQPSPPL